MAARRAIVAVASGSEDLIPTLIERMREIRPDVPLYLVSEFQVEGAQWIPYHVGRTREQNLALARAALAGIDVDLCGLILQPRMPYWNMRWLALQLGGMRTVFFNEQLDHFMLRPRSLPVIARHVFWRARNIARWELRPGGSVYTFLWRLAHPWAFERPLLVAAARVAGWLASSRTPAPAPPLESAPRPDGISVVIPSRDGRELLDRLLPGLLRELEGIPSEVLVSDNGSSDGTERWLRERFPGVTVLVHAAPLSFARACNLGIEKARYAHTMLLNNDMVLEPGFFAPLRRAFADVPDLFCATAQIFFPPGVRREETGKAVMPLKSGREDFPLRCDVPIDGEDQSPVLYGSGGCSLYDTAKLRALGGFGEQFDPAYVEDLDLGWRGWERDWPTVFVSGARLEHRHRSTTKRYFTEAQLAAAVEVNYLRFVAGIADPDVFRSMWSRAVARLNLLAARMTPVPAAMTALRRAWRIAGQNGRNLATAFHPAIGSGDCAVFPGNARRGRPVVLVASPYIPFPLSHGGAVRIYNLMKQAALSHDQVLVCFVDQFATPPREVLDLCAEVVLVRREGSHARPLTGRPDTVEEFDSPVFHAAVQLAARKWRPAVAQLEFTQMAIYADDCRPAPAVLVEHDVTLDLYQQLLAQGEDWETRQQFTRWDRFERNAWTRMSSVVVMSEKDRASVALPHAVTLANGVDLDRFQPAAVDPDPARVLFIGSFAHLPNVLAIDFFLREAWPLVLARRPDARLHVISGKNPRYFLDRCRDRVNPPLDAPGVEVEEFVSDPRAAYQRATVVIAPLLASAGTNIKVMEAMAMGRVVVSTRAGVNGLEDLRDGHDVLIRDSGEAIAGALVDLFADAALRREIERNARATVEERYGWSAIGRAQRALYERLAAAASK